MTGGDTTSIFKSFKFAEENSPKGQLFKYVEFVVSVTHTFQT